MSEAMFAAIDREAHNGIEATLTDLIDVAIHEQAYDTALDAATALAEYRHDMLDSELNTKKVLAITRREFNDYMNPLRQFTGELYRQAGDLEKAAQYFAEGDDFSRAIDLYIQEGSSEAFDSAIELMVQEDINIERGVEMMAERRGYEATFGDLGASNAIGAKKQVTANFLIKRFYDAILSDVIGQIVEKEGKEYVPESESVRELIENRDYVNFRMYKKHTLEQASGWFGHSFDPEVLRIGLELIYIERRTSDDAGFNSELYNSREMRLRIRLGDVDEPFEYFLDQAAKSKNRESKKSNAKTAIGILQGVGRFEEALRVADMYFEPDDELRINILKGLGNLDEILSVHREADNPVQYALAVAARNGST